jgi:hypothetical protein
VIDPARRVLQVDAADGVDHLLEPGEVD